MVAVDATQNGNPQLNPWYSDNIDLGLEYYFGSAGMVSASIFNMNIDSFIETGSSTIRVKDGDGVERRSVPVKGDVNGKGGTIKGVEVAYQQSFDFLPDFWSGLGAGLNMTYAPSESGAVDFYKATLPIADNSERSGNAVLWYERSGVQLRIAANYRSERLASNGTVFGVSSRLPIWTEPTTYIDLSGSYDFTENFTAYASVSNLTEEYENNYLQWEGNVISQNIYERRITLGVRARF
jgi:TonB-dependent receptor